MSNTYKTVIEFYNNNDSKYSIKTNMSITRLVKDENNIKLAFPEKEDIINFEFDTLEDDIYINMNIEKIGVLEIKNNNDFRLNHTIEKYKNRITYKIKWDLKTNKKKIKVKSIIINKINNPYIFTFFEKFTLVI
jgi:hypothetical protein